MKSKGPLLMTGCRKLQRTRSSPEARWEYPLKLCKFILEDAATRIKNSRKHFPFNFYRGDFHSHTTHSDGCGTVAETAEMVKLAGLDFQYVTDHWGITQGPECRKHGLWVGQEPVTKLHHLGILGLNRAYQPKMDFLEDCAELKKLGAVVFIPHPTGWWPTVIYNQERTEILEKLPSPFLMEICNGANNLVSGFDFTDDLALKLWDRLLLSGKIVHALGNTDAHAPHGIGIVWNGVFAEACQEKRILKSVCSGNSFVSNGPLLHLDLGRIKMGSIVKRFDHRKAKLRVTVADSRGLDTMKMIVDGKIKSSWQINGKPNFYREIALRSVPRHYVRIEVRSSDGARGYSNPIYFQ